MRFWLTVLPLLFAAGIAFAGSMQTSAGKLEVTEMAAGLKEPWALAFLPDGGFLVTLRGGAMRYFPKSDGPQADFVKVRGLPKVRARNQGGLLDVVVARDFTNTREIFLSYASMGRGGSATALAVARLSENGARLENLRVIFEMSAFSGAGRHYGSRIVEALDGTLFLTVGDRGAAELAQDTNVHNGKVIRVNRDGTVPRDNPFVNGGGRSEIWSIGHRNPQGAALDLRGNYWLVEHGAKGGDEINRPLKGRNYGWPVISYGRHYSGAKIGEGTKKAGMEQPEFFWDPSIAPSGMMIYSGKMWPKWKGNFFVGSLKFDYISRLSGAGGGLRQVEKLASGDTGRVRDVREAADGSIWFISVDEGAVFRISAN